MRVLGTSSAQQYCLHTCKVVKDKFQTHTQASSIKGSLLVRRKPKYVKVFLSQHQFKEASVESSSTTSGMKFQGLELRNYSKCPHRTHFTGEGNRSQCQMMTCLLLGVPLLQDSLPYHITTVVQGSCLTLRQGDGCHSQFQLFQKVALFFE